MSLYVVRFVVPLPPMPGPFSGAEALHAIHVCMFVYLSAGQSKLRVLMH